MIGMCEVKLPISMARGKSKYYVVWVGRTTGVFAEWSTAERAVKGFQGARFMSFPTRAAAEAAFSGGAPARRSGKKAPGKTGRAKSDASPPPGPALCVDAGWSSRTEQMEFRGVHYPGGEEAFHAGPFASPGNTNNIGEFLAIVDGLRLLDDEDTPIYSDSRTARAWVRDRRVKSVLIERGDAGDELTARVEDAIDWLKANAPENPILIWETDRWGEIPADFGRK